jgi:biotin-(acetyl-CoA carboxylase) ligase
MEDWYNKLRREQYENLENSYINSLYKFNISSWFMSKGKRFSGTIKGTDHHGRLKVQLTDGEFLYFDFKEVEFLSQQ